MPRESKKSVRERSLQIFDLLLQEYPDAHCALEHEGPFQLGVATILSAQTTDERVNMVTPKLFLGYPSPKDLASASQKDVETLIHSTGFFRNKAKNIIGFAKGIVEKHGGKVPRTIEELTALPGVGRKTANVILGNAFGINEGVVVDTHVKRISNLLALTREANPEKVEKDLIQLFPQDSWTLLSHLLIFHGREVCFARRPHCQLCMMSDLCPSAAI